MTGYFACFVMVVVVCLILVKVSRGMLDLQLKNKMFKIIEKSQKSDICWCGISLNIEHVYKCEILKQKKLNYRTVIFTMEKLRTKLECLKEKWKVLVKKEKYDMRKLKKPMRWCEPQFCDIEYFNHITHGISDER